MAEQTPDIPDRAHRENPLEPRPSAQGGSRWPRRLLIIGIVLLLIGGVYYYQHGVATQQAANSKAAAAPKGVPITAAPARMGDIGIYVEALGTVTPVYTVTVTSRVQGEIVNLYYREGQMVHKGDPLIDIDPRPFEAAVKQAEGQLAHDQAVLK